MKKELTNFYNNLNNKTINNLENNININYNFIDGAYVEISNAPEDVEYKVEFKNKKTNKVIFETNLKNNMWARSSLRYFIDYKVVVTDGSTGKIILNHDISLTNKKIFITLESRSLGDTLAWIPQVEEFRKKHNCNLVVSTFWNKLFNIKYPKIKFVEPGTSVPDIYAKYNIGWFWKDHIYVDTDRNPIDPKSITLGQTASDILGLEYKELKPILNIPNRPSNFKKKYVCIATQSTAQAKYWNKKGGWDKIVSYLKSKGYEVVVIDKAHTFGGGELMNTIPNGTIDMTGDAPLEDRMVDLQHAEFFIGLGSGLSWLSWAVGTPTILISSFSKPFAEFEDCIRVYKDSPNSGFFNDSRFRLNASQWNWNPIKECNTVDDWDKFEPIEVEDVIDAVNDMIEGINYPYKVIDDVGQEYDPTQIRPLSPHALVVNSKSIGDTLSVTPTLRKLRNALNTKLDVYTHRPELFIKNPHTKNVFQIDDFSESKYKDVNIHNTFMNVGQTINGIERKHNIFDIRQFHATDLGFMLTPNEMQCEFWPDVISNTEIDLLPNDYVVVHPTKTWDSRSWKQENWQELINLLIKNGNTIVAVGKTDSEHGFWGKLDKNVLSLKENKNYIDLMNKTDITTTWAVLNNSKCVITMDSGILHLAGTTDTNIIQIGSSINYKFRAPYRNGSQEYKYKYIKGGCDFCASNMKYSVKEWGEIQSIAPIVDCLDKRYSKIESKRNTPIESRYDDCHPTAKQVFEGFENIDDDSDQMDLDFKPIHEVDNEIYVEFDSSSLGDNIAWIPYVEKFRKQKNCRVVVATHWNKLYQKEYPNLIFIEPETYKGNPIEKYKVGLFSLDDWEYDNRGLDLQSWDNKNENTDYREVPLQQAASDAFGMEYVEIKPKVTVSNKRKQIKGKYVTLAIQSTAQAKYWNYPRAWQTIVDKLKRNKHFNYKIVVVDQYERFGIEGRWNDIPKSGVINKTGSTIESIVDIIDGAEFHMTISSGLAWVAYACSTPTLMVSGFTKPWNEFVKYNVRIHNDSVCNGCYNDTDCTLPRDEGWLWCPRDKNFECTTSIPPTEIMKGIGKIRRGEYEK